LSFLENALPTAFPSILEPLWVVLNRLLCLLQPLEDLRKGNSRPSRTIRVQYTSLPPQLVFWRALRSQHLILAIVCAVAISSNVLAVTLSNLFNEAPTAVETTIVLPQTYDASIIGDKQITSGNTSRPIVYTDHFYVAMSNLTNGTSLPPWIDNSFFYLPFEIPSNSAQSNFVLSQGASQLQGFLGTTRGFGAETTCQPLLQNAPNNSLIFNPSDNGSTIQFFTQHILPDSANITCISGDQGNLTFLMPGLVPDSAAAVEVVSLMSNSSVDDGGFCKKFLVLGWVRIGPQDINADLATTNGTNGRSFESVFMSCSQHILTAEFNVTVDSTGHILSAQQSGPFDEPESFITTNSTVHLIDQLNNLNTPVPFFGNLWHNDSYTSDWMNSILKAYINSGKLVDPQSLLPDINATIPIVQDVYQRLAAIIIGLNTQIFTPATTDAAVNTTVTLISTRIFMSPLMFQISTTLLGIHLLTAILYYVYRPKRFLPRMPDTIASLIGYISMSHALDTLPHKEEKHPPSRPIADTKRYGFGRFIGVDGKPHVGIEEQYRVIPLQSTNPAVRRRRWDLKAWWQERKMPQTWI
jgi:hypothetical protein